MLRRLKNILFPQKPRHPFDFAALEFPRVDLDAAVKQLGIRDEARRNAAAEIPASSATTLDGPQTKIIEFVGGEAAGAITEAENRLAAYQKRISELGASEPTRQVTELPALLKSELDETLTASRQDLVDRHDEWRGAEDDLRKFRIEYDLLSRRADYPMPRVAPYAIALACLIGQAAVNTYFFALGHPLGIVGGATQAFVIAFIDMLFSFSFGRGLPWRISPRFRWKLVSYTFALLLVAWAPTYNLMVSHFRDALRSAPRDAPAVALNEFLTAPFSLSDAESWLLFVLGLGLSVAAAWTGFKSDDPFPRYGAKDRDARSERDAVIAKKEEVAETANVSWKRVNERLDDLARQAHDNVISLEYTIATKGNLLKNIETFRRQFELVCNAMIEIYRDENTRARTTQPPKYFDRKWVYEVPHSLRGSVDADLVRLEEQRKIATDLSEKQSLVRQEVTEIYRSFQDQLESLVPLEIGSRDESKGEPHHG